MRCEDCVHEKVCEGYSNCETAGLCEPKRPHGEWRDFSDEGYVECPFCEHATTCDDNIEELHYCFFCGAELRKSGEVK